MFDGFDQALSEERPIGPGILELGVKRPGRGRPVGDDRIDRRRHHRRRRQRPNINTPTADDVAIFTFRAEFRAERR
jgi:hypothetical protein